ncbi:hypothetical protein ABZY93_22170 [Streptomyces smyrnaeus]|uniref:hypothetical protein n=1 Tax=Streptomyces smyrnaeus TaxID=1387713 RepID=UPI0033AD2F8E
MMDLQVGITVRLRETGELMRLLAVESVYDSSRRPGKQGVCVETAFMRPLAGGGRERDAPVELVEGVCDHQKPLEEHEDGKRCPGCGALIYPRGRHEAT